MKYTYEEWGEIKESDIDLSDMYADWTEERKKNDQQMVEAREEGIAAGRLEKQDCGCGIKHKPSCEHFGVAERLKEQGKP